MPGSVTRAPVTSTCRSRACGRWRRAVIWYVPQTTGSPPSSAPTAKSSPGPRNSGRIRSPPKSSPTRASRLMPMLETGSRSAWPRWRWHTGCGCGMIGGSAAGRTGSDGSAAMNTRCESPPFRNARTPWPALAMSMLVLALAACSRGLSAQSGHAEPPPGGPPAGAGALSAVAAQPAPAAGPEAAVRALPDFSTLVERYGPAVVNVEVVEKAQQGGGVPGLAPNDPFYDFFRRFGIPTPDQGPQGRQAPVRGAGSGFIINSDGYILTNTHVVANSDEVTVRLTDRREFPAKVVGADERTDVAVIKINGANLPIVKLGDPARLKPGQWVLAIGSPFGFENSATAGIISATSRSVPGENYVPFIQTDVAVNPGNSGGPLFNLQGE